MRTVGTQKTGKEKKVEARVQHVAMEPKTGEERIRLRVTVSATQEP